MAKCACCGKGVTFGIKVSHSHRRSNRTWNPNVKPAPAACVRVRLPARSDQDAKNCRSQLVAGIFACFL